MCDLGKVSVLCVVSVKLVFLCDVGKDNAACAISVK